MSSASSEMKEEISELLRGIERYNPENLNSLEQYVEMQAQEGSYDCESNLAVLKLYQFYPNFFQTNVTAQILLKALTNLPHTDFALCKFLIDTEKLEEEPLKTIVVLGNLLDTCQFQRFWIELENNMEIIRGVTGFVESIRRFVCYVVGLTYQKVSTEQLLHYLNLDEDELTAVLEQQQWQQRQDGFVFITNHEENIKSKNIKEKINFSSISRIRSTFLSSRDISSGN